VGETGTGKELIARAIHQRSTRATQAFIRVNCAAIPPALIASECRGRVSGPAGAAAKLGLPRQTLDSKIKALGIPLQRFKTRSGD
jgi:formate hydrogenlyase transcriptional activator